MIKTKPHHSVKFIAILLSFFSFTLEARESAVDVLNTPTSTLLARIGLGVATNGDSSVVDINPALLAAIKKQYTLFGNFNFYGGFDLFEFGVVDTETTPIAAVFRIRQTTPSTTEIDRKYTLGLAYRIPDTPVSFGIGGNYNQYHMKDWTHSQGNAITLSVGTLYQVNIESMLPLFIGFSVTNLFDQFHKTAYNLGISKGFADDMYTVHADGTISNHGEKPEIAGGIDVKMREFFYLSASLGWNVSSHVWPWGAGIFFDGPRLKVGYSIATHQVNLPGLWQSAGVAIAF